MCERCDKVDEILRNKTLKRAERLAAIALLFIDESEVDDYIGISPKTVSRAKKKSAQGSIDTYPRKSRIVEDYTDRQKKLWKLMSTLKFGTTSGPQTILRNVSQPEQLCKTLGGEYYSRVDLDRELHTAAAWTLSAAKNRRTNLGQFLTNWFNRALDTLPKDVQNKPGYHRPFGE
jgi:hypothetical protein